jgi:hypothetical protein
VRHPRHRAHSVGEEGAVEVVKLVLPDARREPRRHLVDRLLVEVPGAHVHLLAAGHHDVDVGQAETPLLGLFLAFAVAHLRIDVDAVVAGLARGVHDEQADVLAHLGGRKSDPPGLAHQLQHARRQGAEALVEGGHWSAHLLQPGVGVVDDL